MCEGTAESFHCSDDSKVCIFDQGANYFLCIDGCDPLAEDACPDGEECIPGNFGFLCVLDASGDEGQVNDPCMYANSCDPGLYCIGSVNANECDPQADGCCQPFCDLTLPNMCAGAGQECVAWYEEGSAPPKYEKVGICGVPL